MRSSNVLDSHVPPPSAVASASPQPRTLSHLREVLHQDAWHRFPLTLRLLRLSAAKDDRAAMEALFDACTVLCRQRFGQLLSNAIESEEKEAADPLREDSVVSRLLAVFMRREGRGYLTHLFATLLPIAKRSGSGNNATTARRLLEVIEQGTREAYSPQTSLPLTIRRLFAAVYAAITARSNNAVATRQAVITAFFMRFVSPALVNPALYNITLEKEESGGATQHNLLRIAKHLQSFANQPPDAEVQALVDSVVRWVTMQGEVTDIVPLELGGAVPADRQTVWDITRQVSVVRDAMQRHMSALWTSTGPGAEKIHETLQALLCSSLDAF